MTRIDLRRRGALQGASALLLSLTAPSLRAQGAEGDTITWTVPYAPGGATDTLTRYLAEAVGADLKQRIVVENVAGAATAIAATQLTTRPADGSRLMTADITTLAINPALQPKLGYDPQRSFTHLGLVATLPFALVGHAQAAPPSFAALLEVLRKKPDTLNYASAGIGSPHHLAMELLLDRVEGRATHVPFKGVGPAIPELLSGRIEVMFSTFGAVEQHVKSGALRVYGVSGSGRLARHPSVPTIAEQGVPGYEAAAWQGVVGPAGMSDAVRDRLHASLQRVLALEATTRRFQDMGIEPLSGSPAQFREYAQAQARVWTDLVARKGIKAQ